MPSSFFESLGKRVASELSAPSGSYPIASPGRARLGGIMRTTLDAHLNPPPGAMDQALQRRSLPQGPRYGDQGGMEPRGAGYEEYDNMNGDQDPDNGGAPMDAQTCLTLIQSCIAGLTDPDEKSQLIEGLQNLLQSDGQDNGIRANNKGALDRGRRRNGARDNRPGAMDRAISPEVRALNSASFLRRFPDAAKVRFTPNG
jgi:hypothetical protein